MHPCPTQTQLNIFDRLVAAIYGIVDALLPVINAVARTPTRPWQQRANLTSRFNRILQELLALTACIDPSTLSLNPSFPPPRNKPANTALPLAYPLPSREGLGAGRRMRQSPAPPPRNPVTTPVPLLSARQLAKRLATLLRLLEALAQEAGAALPTPLRHLITQARTLAGCHALPTAHPSWEGAG